MENDLTDKFHSLVLTGRKGEKNKGKCFLEKERNYEEDVRFDHFLEGDIVRITSKGRGNKTFYFSETINGKKIISANIGGKQDIPEVIARPPKGRRYSNLKFSHFAEFPLGKHKDRIINLNLKPVSPREVREAYRDIVEFIRYWGED